MNTDITDKAMNGIETATENFKNMLLTILICSTCFLIV